MKFLVDSCLSKYAVDELRKCNYDTIWIAEENNDPGDKVILERAYKENRILVTADKDFGELVFVFHSKHKAIIRLVNIRAIEHGKKILEVITKYKNEINSNPLITVDNYRVRIKFSPEK